LPLVIALLPLPAPPLPLLGRAVRCAHAWRMRTSSARAPLQLVPSLSSPLPPRPAPRRIYWRSTHHHACPKPHTPHDVFR
jgi:hypothetical protein